MKLQPSFFASLLVLAGISSASVANAATTAVYNPTTGLVTVQGIAETQTVTTTAPGSGTFVYTNTNLPYGAATFNLQCGGTISVKIGDAILGELPSSWSFSSGSYVVEGSSVTGSGTEISAPGYTTDTGFVSTLGEATTDFSAVSDLQTTVQYAVPAAFGSPVGIALKGVLVARAAYTCGTTPVVTIGTLASQPTINFPLITSAADPQNVTTVIAATPAPAVPAWGAGLLGVLLAGFALVACRRAPSVA